MTKQERRRERAWTRWARIQFAEAGIVGIQQADIGLNETSTRWVTVPRKKHRAEATRSLAKRLKPQPHNSFDNWPSYISTGAVLP